MSAPAVVLSVAVLALLASLSIMTFGSASGRFLGELVGRLQGDSPNRISHLSNAGAFYGFAAGLVCWLVLVALDLL
jgi:hypothetical protein